MTETSKWRLPKKKVGDYHPADNIRSGFQFETLERSERAPRTMPLSSGEWEYRSGIVTGIGPKEAQPIEHFERRHFESKKSGVYKRAEAKHFEPRAKVQELYTGNKARVYDVANGVLASHRPSDHLDFDRALGVKIKVEDVRNGVEIARPGDKPYSAPEYSGEFHKASSVAVSQWGRAGHQKREMFQLNNPPLPLGASYLQKRKVFTTERETHEVCSLPDVPIAEHSTKQELMAVAPTGKKPVGKK